MSLFHLLVRNWKRPNGWNSVAEELAIQCVGPVRSRLAVEVERMSRHEARGYIRARARPIIKRAVESVIGQPETPVEILPQLSRLVLETTTQLVHQQILNQPTRQPIRRAA